ncbi:MAG: glucosaminidase domain-containing protein, partial [Akkermansiaceae bacterium]|nr:glucosaminidase domain-containing protein [Akkermansiaceae bacterium]
FHARGTPAMTTSTPPAGVLLSACHAGCVSISWLGMKILLPLLMGMTPLLVRADVITDLRPHIRQEAEEKGVDPVLLEAILRHESAHGKSKAAKRKNNLAGIKAGRSLKKYGKKEDSVTHLAEVLAKYKQKGVTSVTQLSRRYCAGSPSAWAQYINRYMASIRKGSYDACKGTPASSAEPKRRGGWGSQNAPDPEEIPPPEEVERSGAAG